MVHFPQSGGKVPIRGAEGRRLPGAYLDHPGGSFKSFVETIEGAEKFGHCLIIQGKGIKLRDIGRSGYMEEQKGSLSVQVAVSME